MSQGTHIQAPAVLSSLAGIRSVYFVGIGGIGMSALARYFLSRGVAVSGYDKTETVLSRQLAAEGINITYKDDVSDVPPQVDLVVYTPAIPKEHAGLTYYRNNQFKIVKRSDVLQAISADSFNICIAGTHGKTTLTTMIAHILRHSGYGCNAFLGGIAANYGTNFWSSSRDVCVIEADEYDRSFLKLSPDIAIITAMDADHLDIYGDEATMQQAFIDFAGKVKKGGLLLSRFGLQKLNAEPGEMQKSTYSLGNNAATVYASNITIDEGGYTFNVHTAAEVIESISLPMGGMHNVENMVGAVAVAKQLDIDATSIKAAIKDFKGVKRRFEYILPPQNKQQGAYTAPVLIDDYAHHPEELKALLRSARTLFPQRKITVIFQPHLYSRTRDFDKEFGRSLSLADRIILLPIYGAREQPIEGVTSDLLLEAIDSADKRLMEKAALLAWTENYATKLDKEFGEVFITAGAGDIDALVQPLKDIIEKA